MLLAQRFGRLSSWTPADLLTSGPAKGFWYDPQDLSTLFQTSTATTAVGTSGDVVGYIIDKSGQGNHAVRAGADTARAAWTATTDGRPYLLFDGTSDCYALPTNLTQAVGSYTICFALYPTSITGNAVTFSSQDNSSGERLSLFFNTTAQVFGDRTDGGAGATFTGSTLVANTAYVLLFEENFYSGISEMRVNRTITRASFLTTGVTNNTAASFIYIGAFPNAGAPSSFYVGRMFGMFGIGHRLLMEGEKQRLMNFMGRKMGLVI